jgi:OOP family OmpA-OmpF porin
MRLSYLVTSLMSFGFAAGISAVAANFAALEIEERTEIAVRQTLDATGHGWAEVAANGLQVALSGTAPDEAARFTAISETGRVVEASRIIDQMQIAPGSGLVAPAFSAEILRNDAGVTIVGLLPGKQTPASLIDDLTSLSGATGFANLIEYADYPVPRGWDDAMGFAVIALQKLPRAKISVEPGQVSIKAITDSAEEKAALTEDLTRAAPPGLRLALDIAAPRPVVTPFTLRFTLDENGGQFDACTAESEASRDRIVETARASGLTGSATCVVGMGVPSPYWADAAEASIRALSELGAGSVTIANADVTLAAVQGADAGRFEKIAGDLDAALPEVFALHAVLPVPETDQTTVTPEFTATYSPEGLVQLRGRLNDAHLREMAESYARARFGSSSVHTATRIAPEGLSPDWPVRVLAGLEALSRLTNGFVAVTPDLVALRGVSHNENAAAEIAGLLSEKLGEAQTYDLDITWRAPPEPEDKTPEPEECEQLIGAVQETSKIAFEPGSATIAASSAATMDRIAEIMMACGPVRMEIQGHTDSQGRESMNQQLSQARAQSVLNELRARRVRTSSLAAVGYGESRPIAPNDTEEGREANRRIEFWLIRPDASSAEEETTLDSAAAAPDDTETQPDTETETGQETGNEQN